MTTAKRPWRVVTYESLVGHFSICDADGCLIPATREMYDFVVACVNALDGLNPEAIKGLVDQVTVHLAATECQCEWCEKLKAALAAAKEKP